MNFANYSRLNALKYSDKICLIERYPEINGRRTLTWKAFNDGINRVANFLKKRLGIKKGDRVLHLLNNSLEWLICYFGIIKIGGVVVPLNFRFISEDIKYAGDTSKPVAFILGTSFLESVRSIQQDLATVKNYIVVGEECPSDMITYTDIEGIDDTKEAMIEMADEDDLALMFTSGTTGNAKPVIHTHGSLNATAVGNGMSMPLHIEDNYMIVHPLYHSGSMFLWFPYYAIGAAGTLILEYRNPRWILEAVHEDKCTGILVVVPVCVDLINQINNKEVDLNDYNLSSWQYLSTGAQPVPHHIFESLMAFLPCKIIHTYGVTEGGGGVTWTISQEDILRKPGAIGKPNFCIDGKIVDDQGEDVLQGEVGELIIKSPRLMKGYYQNPEMTAKSIKNGFFYTGDLARMDDEGYYYIVDRKKDLITCGGENIYPVEIEEVLHSHPGIDDAAVIGYPDERLVEVVMAVVQTKEGLSLSEEEVIEFCKSKLARYKVPR
ncbi:MAG: acyl--CoA ligase, partial [Deltaproteobacteria bacterium]|nr:acyl--CoA ligase [Deltaproteobacteria bacterium]